MTPASTAELTSATVRNIAAIRLILLMLFIILIFFLVLAFRDSSLLRTQFRPFTGVLGGIWRFVTRKDAEDLQTTDYTDLTDRIFMNRRKRR